MLPFLDHYAKIYCNIININQTKTPVFCFFFFLKVNAQKNDTYIHIYIYKERKGRMKADLKHIGSIQEAPKGKNKKKKGYKKSHQPSSRTQPIQKVD